ncbi:unknown [Bacteroides sp. CAG:702]|nr:unknown [Bacteroides sp. CAG:702]
MCRLNSRIVESEKKDILSKEFDKYGRAKKAGGITVFECLCLLLLSYRKRFILFLLHHANQTARTSKR